MGKGYRKRCFSEKGRGCVGCGVEENLVVHHVDGDRDNNELANLIPVCKSCHAVIHNGLDVPEQLQQYRDALPEDSVGWLQREDTGERVAVEVSESVWYRLSLLKSPGDSFNDVIWELLEAGEEEVAAHEPPTNNQD